MPELLLVGAVEKLHGSAYSQDQPSCLTMST
jgi:hypothetical protein